MNKIPRMYIKVDKLADGINVIIPVQISQRIETKTVFIPER